MLYKSGDKRNDYFPPILGNGDMSFGVDPEGTLKYNAAVGTVDGVKRHVFGGEIVRQGRRINRAYNTEAALLTFGSFEFSCGSALADFEQELDVYTAQVKSTCRYEDGQSIQSVAVMHPHKNIFALKKTFSKPAEVSFVYRLDTANGFKETAKFVEKEIREVEITPDSKGATVSFYMEGCDTIHGKLELIFDQEVKSEVDGRTVTFTKSVEAGESLTFYLLLEDDMFDDYEALLCENRNYTEALGFDGLTEAIASDWSEYYAEGYVKTGDSKVDSVYATALYHLRCYTTRWSIPVGLNNACWMGGFFAFDEYYNCLGLLSSGRLDLARHVPDFRLKNCLKRAIHNHSHVFNNGAKYMWITGEHGQEIGPNGFWLDHIFHMAVVALGAYECYEYSGDTELLKQYYPLILSSAKYYTMQSVYTHPDGSVTVGKCTDLERLGPSRENPFMTTCGVIKTLECLVKAADVLGVDKEYRDQCEKIAMALRAALPNDGTRYVPYKGCEQQSISVFSAKYPFNVLDDNDTMLLDSWDLFLNNQDKYGNMYRMGGGISSWYAAWKSVAFARIKKGDEAFFSIKESCQSVGCFDEMFEINEQAVVYRPWFTTAAGVYLCAVNEMLLQSDGENIYILPAYPLETASFKLPAKGGATVEVSVENGELKKLEITAPDEKRFNVYFKNEKIEY